VTFCKYQCVDAQMGFDVGKMAVKAAVEDFRTWRVVLAEKDYKKRGKTRNTRLSTVTYRAKQ